MLAMTEKQAQILAFIVDFTGVNGYPPTNRDIQKCFGFRSANAARDHLSALVRKGAIAIDAATARGIRVLHRPAVALAKAPK